LGSFGRSGRPPRKNRYNSIANGRQKLPIDWVRKLHGIELPACYSDGGAKPHAWAEVNLTASAEARQTFALLAATHPVAIGGKFVLKAAALPQQERGGFYCAMMNDELEHSLSIIFHPSPSSRQT
jgi:hypothetical protein